MAFWVFRAIAVEEVVFLLDFAEVGTEAEGAVDMYRWRLFDLDSLAAAPVISASGHDLTIL